MNPIHLLEKAAAHANQGRFDQAARACRQVLERDRNQPDANHMLGQILLRQGQTTAAIPYLEAAARQRANDPAARYHLGRALLDVRRDADAVTHLSAAIALDPFEAASHVDLGVACARLERDQEATKAFNSALALQPKNITALIGLARLALGRGDGEQAEQFARRALAVDAAMTDASAILARALHDLGRHDEAAAVLREGLARAPDDLGLVTEMATLANSMQRAEEANTLAARLRALAPGASTTWFISAQARLLAGDHDGAFADLDRGATLDSNRGVAAAQASALLMLLQYPSEVPTGTLVRRHHEWSARYAAGISPAREFANTRDPERRLRVGFVSPDFVLHSVSLFFAPYLELHDSRQVETFCYATHRRTDDLTKKLIEWSDHWRPADRGDSVDLAAMARNDRIDILVDLTGHTASNRMLAFALRPAPVQVTWLGYPGTTGLAAIDWRISDAICDPLEDDGLSAERVFRLDHGFHPYVPPPETAPVPPREPAHPITFGSFNNFMKLSRATLDLWARALAAVPGARLALKSSGAATTAAGAGIVTALGARGIDPTRVTVLPHQRDYREHLALYAGVDIGLDPTPYCGTTTTCEALWMGVPVVTLTGDRHAARVGASLLTQVGLPELIAATPDEYVAIAANLAGDAPRLAALRAGMRQRLRASPLLDTHGFARRFEAALRDMWREWCARR